MRIAVPAVFQTAYRYSFSYMSFMNWSADFQGKVEELRCRKLPLITTDASDPYLVTPDSPEQMKP